MDPTQQQMVAALLKGPQSSQMQNQAMSPPPMGLQGMQQPLTGQTQQMNPAMMNPAMQGGMGGLNMPPPNLGGLGGYNP